MLILQHRIYRSDLRANPDVFYVFGDNEMRLGLGGQAAEMRGEPNAIGIATKRSPGTFWYERDTPRQNRVIDSDLKQLFWKRLNGHTIILPSDGLGTGLSELSERAPATLAHLQHRLRVLKMARGLYATPEFRTVLKEQGVAAYCELVE